MSRNERQYSGTSTMVIGLVVCFIVTGPVHAQFTASAQTNVINGVTSNWVGTYGIGYGSLGARVGDALIITNAGVLNSTDGLLGNGTTETNNFALVTGSGSSWNNTGTLTIGVAGRTNTLMILNGGGVVDAVGQIGTGGNSNAVVVSGNGSVWSNTSVMYVGFAKYNSLTIANGGAVVNGGPGFVGYDPASSGGGTGSNTVIVTGTGSVLDNSAGILRIGYVGQTNALIVNSGGKVLSGNAYVGVLGSNTSVKVTGAGSAWIDAGFLNMGLIYGNFNTMVVSNGGTVSVSGTTSIGYGSASKSNSVIVGGSGASFTGQGAMYVGESGSSNSLTITSGGTVSAPNVYVGLNASSAANSLTLNGGTLNAQNSGTGGVDVRRGTLTMNAGSRMNVDQFTATNDGFSVVALNGGTLNTAATAINNGQRFNAGNGLSLAVLNLVNNGTHTFANGILINTNASLTGQGTIVGDMTSAGRIAPAGNLVGIITINGNLTLQRPSVLDIQIGGHNQGTDYDTIFVNGSVSLDGMLRVSIINGFYPYDSWEGFTILQGNSPLGGTFTNIVNGGIWTVGQDWFFGVYYVNNSVWLGWTPEPSTSVLCVIGLVALFAARRRQ